MKVENQFKILEVDEDEDDKNYFIGNVEKAKNLLQVGAGEITIDSAADETVCPQSWGRTFPTRLVPEEKKMKFWTASGGKMDITARNVSTSLPTRRRGQEPQWD